jgi:hypothetical protein
LTLRARPPPLAPRHAMGRAPPAVKMNPRPCLPARPIGRMAQNHHLPLLLLPLPPPNLTAAFLDSASPAPSPTTSPSPYPSSSSSPRSRRGSPPSQPSALATTRWRSKSQSPPADPSSQNRITGSKGRLGKKTKRNLPDQQNPCSAASRDVPKSETRHQIPPSPL